jgi:RNA-directed DNA polymerase
LVNMEIELKATPEILVQKFKAIKTFDDLADLLEVNPDYLKFILYRIPLAKRYTIFQIPKRTKGKYRIIANPIKPIKVIQKKLLTVLELIYEPRCSAMGFIEGRDILANANRHSQKKKGNKRRTRLNYVLNVDIKDFFPSIHHGRVRGLFANPPYNLPRNIANYIAQICCYEHGLPQGAPTSPIISNMLCNRLDSQLQRLAEKSRCTYTRYADDITFSTNLSRFPSGIAFIDKDGTAKIGGELQRIMDENYFEVHPNKIRLQTPSQRQVITGLVVNRFPNVPRKYIKEIRAILHDWYHNGYEKAQKKHLEKYHNKHRYPDKEALTLRDILVGKVAFLGMIRGSNDSIYRRYGLQLERLIHRDLKDDTYVFKGSREVIEGDIMTDSSAMIFINYARDDDEPVSKIYSRLKKAGYKPWRDKEDIVGGDTWERAIARAIDECDIFVACLTVNSVRKRGWIQKEIRQALEKRQGQLEKDIFIIPLLLEKGIEIPESLAGFQAIPYYEDNGWNRLTQSIQESLRRARE